MHALPFPVFSVLQSRLQKLAVGWFRIGPGGVKSSPCGRDGPSHLGNDSEADLCLRAALSGRLSASQSLNSIPWP